MKPVKINTAVQMRNELNKARNDKDDMPCVVIIEGNRHEIKYVQTVTATDDPNKPKGEFQIVAGDGIGE